MGTGNQSIQNDPTALNILAWTLGGSTLISGTASAIYHRRRLKNGK